MAEAATEPLTGEHLSVLDNKTSDDTAPDPMEGAETDRPSDLSSESSDGTSRSLTDDLLDLVDDGKNYAHAEMAFQKTRMAYTADRGKGVAAFGVGALLFVHLGLVALVVGAVIALTPALTAWGATAVVVVVLFGAAAAMGIAAKNRISSISAAFKSGDV